MRAVAAVGLFLGATLIACPSTDALLVSPLADAADAGSTIDAATAPTDASTEAEAAPAPRTDCQLYLSPTGSDDAPGSLAAPLRTLAKLEERAQDGQLVCLLAGKYEDLVLTRANLTLTEAGDGKATVARLVVAPSATGTTLDGLTIVGPSTSDAGAGPIAAVSVRAATTTLRGLEVSIGADNGQSCIIVDAVDVSITRSRLHHCHDGVRVLKGASRLKVKDSTMYKIGNDGLLLDRVSNCELTDSIVYDALNCVSLFGDSDGSAQPSNNVVRGSILSARGSGHAFRAEWAGPTSGTNNVIEDCCLASPQGVEVVHAPLTTDPGYTETDNDRTEQDLIFSSAVDRDNPSFHLTPGTKCATRGPRP